jgi:hypothetical protein
MGLRIAPLVMTVLALLASACGSDGGGAPQAGLPAEAETAWLDLLAEQGATPSENAVDVVVTGGAPTLTVTITVPENAAETVTFGDGLYGAQAFTFADGSWSRVDTAEIRTEIAPLLESGQSATVELPVEEAENYRVLVPVMGAAAWGDL